MVMRFDPFRDLERLAQLSGGATQQVRAIPMDAYRRGEAVFVHFDVPGIDPSTIELTVEQNVLRVSAERYYERKEGDQIIVRERPEGVFERQMFLGDHLDGDRLQASYDRGVLTVQVPVAASAQPRRIEIRAGEASSHPEAIDIGGSSSDDASREGAGA